MEIMDMSNPASPTLVGSYKPETKYYGMSVTNTVTSVEVVNNYAYLTVHASMNLGGLWILDISQFTNTNTFTGTLNADTLTGTNGADTLIGLAGNDTYTVNHVGDIVTEALNAGTDLVNASISYTLTNHVENLTLTGSGNINGTGNTANNVITGNSANNNLNGGAGNDTLNGGADDDIYVVDITDTITEDVEGGTDTIQSSFTYTIEDITNVENLTLTGIADIDGTGNTGNNVITGNSANN
ncbi:MAG: hypothetical protein ACKPGB_19185, partial [Dolichospermum sp.]